MKLKIITTDKTEIGSMMLPKQFDEPLRQDLIKRVVLSLQNAARQPYGAKVGAGQRYSVELSKRRRKYRGSYGIGISRIPRKILSRRGTRMNWVGAVVPGTVGGRRAHPPKAIKVWEQKVNVKEKRKATRSAISATLDQTLVMKRGHKPCKEYPFIVEDKFELVSKAADVKKTLLKMGFMEELSRLEPRTRAGKGKMRGRKKKTAIGPLIVVSGACNLLKAAANLPGIDAVVVDSLNPEMLAPGTHAGRLTIFTKGAVDRMAKENLFTNNIVKEDKKEKQEQVKTPAKTTPEKKNAIKKTPTKKASAKKTAKPVVKGK